MTDTNKLEAPAEIPEPEIDPLDASTWCAWCGDDAKIHTGWDDDGKDIFETCPECNGEGGA